MLPRIPLSSIDDEVAQNKGRLLAAQNMAHSPEKRKECEQMFGLDYCKRRWPEAYAKSPFFKRLIDKLQFRAP